ncbi:MAG: hypothetical protein AAF196_12050 [Planctomycetota bacterium]
MNATVRRWCRVFVLLLICTGCGGCEWLRNEFFIYDQASPNALRTEVVSPFADATERLEAEPAVVDPDTRSW